jgi:C-terminal processing protease CtpA/Prc
VSYHPRVSAPRPHAPRPPRAPAPLACALAILVAACGPSIGTVGAILGVDPETGAVHVRETREGLAADKAGLLPGDEIVMIDGVYVRDLGAAAVRDRLRGNIGSSVELTVVRGGEVLRVKLVRSALGAATARAPQQEERIAP